MAICKLLTTLPHLHGLWISVTKYRSRLDSVPFMHGLNWSPMIEQSGKTAYQYLQEYA